MILSIVTDELGLTAAESFALIRSWGVDHVELRGLTGGRIPDGDVDEAADLVAQHGMTVTSISPGVFKCGPTESDVAEHLDRLRRTIEVCPRLGCRPIIVFTLQSPSPDRLPAALVVDAISEAGRLAEQAGLRIALENEPGYTAVGARRLAALVDAVGMPNVGANWDPGNAWPFDPEIDDGPAILADRLFNVHVKDTAERDGARVFDAPGLGEIDWQAQLAGLRFVGYDGPIVVETHCEPRVEKSHASVATISGWLR